MKIIMLFLLFSGAAASFCGQAAVPFTFQVLRAGYPVLGCARPRCFGWTANGTRVADSAQFYRVNGKEDGYLRRSDVLLRQPFKTEGFVPQVSTCENTFRQNGCDSGQWVGGLSPQSDAYTPTVQTRCCSFGALFNSEDRGIAVLHPGQMVVGGEVTSNGRLIAFDYIANLNKVIADNGTIVYNVHVRRMPCFDDDNVQNPESIVAKNAIIRDAQRGLEKNPLDVAPSDISLQSVQEQPAVAAQPLATPTQTFAQPPGYQQVQQQTAPQPVPQQPQAQVYQAAPNPPPSYPPQQSSAYQQQYYQQQQVQPQYQQAQPYQQQNSQQPSQQYAPQQYAPQQYSPQQMQQTGQQPMAGQQPLQPQQQNIQQLNQQTVANQQQNALFPMATLFPQSPQQQLMNGMPTLPTLPPIKLPRLEDIPKIDIPSIEDVEQSIPPVQRAILTSVARFFGVL